jgi:filamentous hemagglutinin family protein
MTARPTRTALRSSLTRSTALAGSLVAFATVANPAAAQTNPGQLPNGGDAVVVGGAANATITGGSVNLPGPPPSTTVSPLVVNVNANNAVIQWSHFDVPTGTTANFVNTNGAAGSTVAVLNQVTSVGAQFRSDLSGAINGLNSVTTGDATDTRGVEVWISNPNGILFGPNAAINTNGFVATTLAISATDFANGGSLSLTAPLVGTSGSITGGRAAAPDTFQINSNGGVLALVAPVINVNGAFDAGTGDAAFVTATAVTMQTPGSPLALQIDAGVGVGGGQTVAGTVSGNRALFVLSAQALVDALLDVQAGVTTASTAANGVVILAGNATTNPDAGVAFGAENALQTRFTGGGRVTISGAVNAGTGGIVVGARTDDNLLAVNPTPGTITAIGALTAGTLSAQADGAITMNSVGNAIATTTRLASADGAVSLFNNTALNVAGSGASGVGVTIFTVGSALTITGDVDATAAGPVSLTGTGLTINGTVTGDNVSLSARTGTLAVNNTVTVNGDYLVTAADFTGADVFTPTFVGTGNDVTINDTAGGLSLAALTAPGTLSVNVQANGTLDVAGTLTSTAEAIVLNAVGGITLNAGLTATGAGGALTLVGPVNLGTNVTLATSGNATFQNTVDAALADTQTLTINAGGTTRFNGAVGATRRLGGLTTNAAGNTVLAGGTVNAVTQQYNDDVTLAANTTIGGTSATFADGLAGAGFDLALNLTGTTTIDGADVTGVRNLSTGAGGTTELTGTILTSGTQTYGDAVTLTGATTLDSSGTGAAGAITFNNTLNGAQALTVNTDGTLTFGGIVGGADSLLSITTDPGGVTQINTTNVSTSGAQIYNDAVQIGTGVTATLSGASLRFVGTVDGPGGLTLNASGAKTFEAAVGGGSPLATLTVNGAGALVVNGGTVNTVGLQLYNSSVTLGADAIFAGSGAQFFAGLDGAGNDLTLNYTGATFLNGSFTNIEDLTTGGGGDTQLSGTIVTTGTQTYNDAVLLNSTTTLRSTGAGAAGNITFANTLNGVQALTVETPNGGTTRFSGVVGGLNPLTSLTTDAAGTTVLATSITATTQQYNDAVTLAGNTTIAGTSATFAGGLAGANFDLTLSLTGLTTISGTNITGVRNLRSNGGGTTQLSGTIATTGSQTYDDAVELTGATTLTTDGSQAAGDVTFAAALDGGFALTVNAPGVTRFNSLVGSAARLTSITTDEPGSTVIATTAIQTDEAQTYNDAITLASSTTLSSFGAGALGDITLAAVDATVPEGQSLTVNTAGTTRFTGRVGFNSRLDSLTTDIPGDTVISGGVVTTENDQFYGDFVTLGADTILTGRNLLIGNVDGNGNDLTLRFDNAGVIGGQYFDIGDLDVGGRAAAGTGGEGGGGACIAINTCGGGGVGSGTTVINGTLLTGGSQTYRNNVTLAGTTTRDAGGNVSFLGRVDGNQTLIVRTSAATQFFGQVGGLVALASLQTDSGGTTEIRGGLVRTADTGIQNYNDQVLLFGNTQLRGLRADFNVGLNGQGNDLTLDMFDDQVIDGARVTGVRNLDTDRNIPVSGTTRLQNTLVTSGTQLFRDAVVLAGATTLRSTGAGAAGNITFDNTINGAQALGIETPNGGTTRFNGVVGGTTRLTSLTTDAPGTTIINTASINTSQVQTYNDAVTLAATTTLSSLGAGALGNITLGGTVDAATPAGQALTVNTGGTTTFGGRVGFTSRLDSLTTDAAGTTAINGGVVTTQNAQTYNDPLSLGADTVLTGGGFNHVGTLNGNNHDLSLFFDASIVIDGSFVNIRNLRTGGRPANGSGPGGGGAGGGGGGVGSGTTLLSGIVTTSGSQSYGNAVSLIGDATLNAGGDVDFASTVDGARALSVNTSAVTRFYDSVGTTTRLTSLTTDLDGTTEFRNTGASVVQTTGTQTFGDAVQLFAPSVTFSSTGAGAAGNITFSGTLDGTGAGGQDVAVGTAGATTFGGQVGQAVALGTLETDAAGTLVIDTDRITTNDAQTFRDPAILRQSATLTNLGTGAAGAVTFANTIDALAAGVQGLTVNTAGATTFGGVIGGATRLESLITDAAGTVAINGGSVTTQDAQSYGDAATIGANTVLTSTAGGNIGFGQTLDGAFALGVVTAGNTRFGGAVGDTTALVSIDTDAPGTTTIAGARVRTTRTQTYNDALILAADTLVTSEGAGALGAVTFAGTVDGAQSLGVNTAGLTTFGGAVGAGTRLTSLTTDAPGATAINGGSVETTGAQLFGDAVRLGADTTLDSSGAGAITLAQTVDGARALIVNTAGLTTLGGAVGGGTALTELTTDAAGTVRIDGGSVRTTGAQTYNDTAVLGASATLTAGTDVTFAQTLDALAAGTQGLTVNAAGTTRFAGAVGGTAALLALGTDAPGTTRIDGGLVRTATTQTYGDNVLIGADTLLQSDGAGAAGDIAFAGTLDGGFALEVRSAGTLGFAKAVGGTDALASLLTDADGTTAINGGSVRTTGAQTYNDLVSLGTDTVLTGTTAAFNAAPIALVGNGHDLTLNFSGASTLDERITGVRNLLTDAAGTTIISTSVTTSGTQTYNDAVTVANAAQAISTGNAAITFAATVDAATPGGGSLGVTTGGTTTFGGAVGDTAALASLTTDAPGLTVLNGGRVTTTGDQSFGDAVVLGANTVLTSTAGGLIGFGGTVNGAQTLDVRTQGLTRFAGAVGNVTALASLATDAGGTTAIDGGTVTTSGSQVYGDAVTLGAGTTLTSTAWCSCRAPWMAHRR